MFLADKLQQVISDFTVLDDPQERLAAVGITVNRNTVPFDEHPPTVASGIRVGTPAMTMRGLDEDDFPAVSIRFHSSAVTNLHHHLTPRENERSQALA